ncbi:MAG: ribosome maturation factor RimM [Proteobacteria bacterium]|nr:ribosome maturation factor RimM [Pseudomonadota bacterium]
MPTDERLLIGKVSGCFGVQGWLKIFSYSNPRENITTYKSWIINNKVFDLVVAKKHGKLIVAKLEGIDDKDTALLMIGQKIEIDTQQLAELDGSQFYWRDLVGLDVTNTNGIEFGKLQSILETAAHDVIFVQGEKQRVIPFIMGSTILTVDLDKNTMLVDWHEDD